MSVTQKEADFYKKVCQHSFVTKGMCNTCGVKIPLDDSRAAAPLSEEQETPREKAWRFMLEWVPKNLEMGQSQIVSRYYSRDEVTRVLAAFISQLRLHQPSPEWRIMANAPKDGTHILVISDSNLIPTPVHWFDDGWHLSSNRDGNHSEYAWGKPTEWIPLPEIPQ